MPRILAFSGSARAESFNQRLVGIAAAGARAAGAEVTLVNLADYPMPFFNQDLEDRDGMPEHARAFKRLLAAHDGFLIASPEYNSAFTPLLKNTLDWASRTESDDEPGLMAFKGKVAVIMAASPGGFGGIRSLMLLRLFLNHLAVLVLPDQLVVPFAHKAFNPDGSLAKASEQEAALALGRRLAEALGRRA